MPAKLFFPSIGGSVWGRVVVSWVRKSWGVSVGKGIARLQGRYGMSFQNLKCH